MENPIIKRFKIEKEIKREKIEEEKRKVNRDSYNVILDTVDLLIHSVDETTKNEMIQVLWDTTNTLKLIKQDYDAYMNTKK